MREEQSIFIEFLKKKGLKLTGQRELILDTFLKTEKHLSVEDLYSKVKRRDKAVGQTTVFRTLKLLAQAGIAREVELGDKVVRYEHEYGHQHHDHIICLECGTLVEAMDPEIEKLQDELCKKFGFVSVRHKLKISGICKKCRKK